MTTDTATDTVATVVEAVNSETDTFAQESSKTLLTAAASTAAVVIGAIVLTKAYNKVTEFRTNRAAKKIEEQVHVVTDMPETETVN